MANDGPVIAPEVLAGLTDRFARGPGAGAGSGLGLAIVAAIAQRTGQRLDLHSPRLGADAGVEVRFGPPPPTATPG